MTFSKMSMHSEKLEAENIDDEVTEWILTNKKIGIVVTYGRLSSKLEV